jgi:hypothetical protein
MFLKPKDQKLTIPTVHVYADGREECNYLVAGRAEYGRRITLMLDRQNGICCLHGHAPMCPGQLRRQGATFEHQHGRGHGGGKHDDRTELPDGTWVNGAAHWECNNWKGSRYIDYNAPK